MANAANQPVTDRLRKLAGAGARRLSIRFGNSSASKTPPPPAAPVEMDPPEVLHEYWRQPSPPGNDPESYRAPVARSAALHKILVETVWPRDVRILEVGCGIGRNLAYLVDNGYPNVEGIEINPRAVELARKTYPQLADVPIHVGAAEDILPTLEEDSFRLVFTMSTLAHIHPDQSAVFDDMARVGAQLLVIEGPPLQSHRLYPHDYEKIFGSRGMEVMKTWPLSSFAGIDAGFGKGTATFFSRMDSHQNLQDFWRQPEPEGNKPNHYIAVVGRSAALLEMISDLPKDAHIIEVGCNVGRNIAYLYDHGYTNLEAIEINPHAVELLRKTYPQLADVPVHIGTASEMLAGFDEQSFDLVFTMAVLEHIHPDESAVFDHMVRVGKEVLAIEPPGRLTHRTFPHDIQDVFESRGLKQQWARSMKDFPSNAKDWSIHKYVGRRFARP
jgi:SAM-dependent methyltransferase